MPTTHHPMKHLRPAPTGRALRRPVSLLLLCAASSAFAEWGRLPVALSSVAGDRPALTALPDGRVAQLVGNRMLRQTTMSTAVWQDLPGPAGASRPLALTASPGGTLLAAYALPAPALYLANGHDATPDWTALAAMQALDLAFLGETAYVAHEVGSEVRVTALIPSTGATRHVITLPAGATALASDTMGGLLIVHPPTRTLLRYSSSQLAAAALLQAGDGELVATLPTGGQPVGLVVDGLARPWISLAGSANLHVWNESDGEWLTLVGTAATDAVDLAAVVVAGRAHIAWTGHESDGTVHTARDLAVLHGPLQVADPLFANGMQDAGHPYDAGWPGFTGPDGLGAARLEDGLGGWIHENNVVNPAFAGWASAVADYQPADEIWEGAGDWSNTNHALGPVTGAAFHVTSLGELEAHEIAAGDEPGFITLTFSAPIVDGPGADFVVFENGLISQGLAGEPGELFAELAAVEVSSDGISFVRFPSVSLSPPTAYPDYRSIDPRHVYHLAGKHANNDAQCWGTPFDLNDLALHEAVQSGALDLQNVRYVRIVDVPGSNDFPDGGHPPRPILDAWPTWGSGGFDLEAVGVVHQQGMVHVTARSDGNGRIDPCGYPDGLVAAAAGADVLFTFTPAADHDVEDVLVNGVSQGLRDTSFTLRNAQQGDVVDVRFRRVGVTAHGTPHAWLEAHGLTTLSPEEEDLLDRDEDGFLAWQEYLAGTDPKSAASVFHLWLTRDGSGLELHWHGSDNGSQTPFRVEGSGDGGTTWYVLDAAVVRQAGPVQSWPVPAGIPPTRLYRVRVPEEVSP